MPARGSRRRGAELGAEVPPPPVETGAPRRSARGAAPRGLGARAFGGRPRDGGIVATSAGSGPDDERRSIFAKTKMCKFFILGTCTKGSDCRFAHHAEELNQLPDLFCTKLCKALISTGRCNDKDCRYAHNKGELRSSPGVCEFLDSKLGEQDDMQFGNSSTSDRHELELGSAHMGPPVWVMMPTMMQDGCAPELWAGFGAAWMPTAVQWAADGPPEAQAWLQEEDAGLWTNLAEEQHSQWPPTDQGHEADWTQGSAPASIQGRASLRQRITCSHMPDGDDSPEAPSSSPLVVIKNTFLHVDAEKPTKGLKQVSTWGGNLSSAAEFLGDDDTADGAASHGQQLSSGGSEGE